jgi:hypothetical protein
MFYELVLLVALWIAAGFLFLAFHKNATTGAWRFTFQIYLLAVTGMYFIAFWRWGQTLPMKTWRIRLTDAMNRPPSLKIAALRYLLALAGTALFGVGLLWALFDRDRQFLHDRLLGLRLCDTHTVPEPRSSSLDPVDGKDRQREKDDRRSEGNHEGWPVVEQPHVAKQPIQEIKGQPGQNAKKNPRAEPTRTG